MNEEIRKIILINPNRLHDFELEGLDLVAMCFEIQAFQNGFVSIEGKNRNRDNHGHFSKNNGETCTHVIKEKSESVKRKEVGVKAIKNILKGKVDSSEMITANGQKIIFEKGTEKYGIVHFEKRRTAIQLKDNMTLDKVIDGVAKALATAEPYENKGNLIYDYKGFRGVCKEIQEDKIIFIIGYDINDEKA